MSSFREQLRVLRAKEDALLQRLRDSHERELELLNGLRSDAGDQREPASGGVDLALDERVKP